MTGQLCSQTNITRLPPRETLKSRAPLCVTRSLGVACDEATGVWNRTACQSSRNQRCRVQQGTVVDSDQKYIENRNNKEQLQSNKRVGKTVNKGYMVSGARRKWRGRKQRKVCAHWATVSCSTNSRASSRDMLLIELTFWLLKRTP